MRLINPPTLPVPRGYTHGVLVTGGSLLCLGGQIAADSGGRIVAPGNLVGQFEQVVRNLQKVVEAAGGSLQDIVKLNIFVRDRDAYLANLRPLGQVYRALFGDHYPAMALFEVSGFFEPEALIEIEGLAVVGQRR